MLRCKENENPSPRCFIDSRETREKKRGTWLVVLKGSFRSACLKDEKLGREFHKTMAVNLDVLSLFVAVVIIYIYIVDM